MDGWIGIGIWRVEERAGLDGRQDLHSVCFYVSLLLLCFTFSTKRTTNERTKEEHTILNET